jgi:hypothetical protein
MASSGAVRRLAGGLAPALPVSWLLARCGRPRPCLSAEPDARRPAPVLARCGGMRAASPCLLACCLATPDARRPGQAGLLLLFPQGQWWPEFLLRVPRIPACFGATISVPS